MWYLNLPTTDKKLGCIYTKDKTTFRVWSPLKDQIILLLYPDSLSVQRKSYRMLKSDDGVHELTIEGDLKGFFYTYLIDGVNEVTDPYSLASSANSIRSAIVDLRETNPPNWDNHHIPTLENDCDAIIYEVHIRDFTINDNSGVKNRGKYLGFAEENTKYNNLTTGIDHLKELGVTHIHLMPIFDFLTVREDIECFYDENSYNWGYDPELYNVPEGSYATNPQEPVNRIKELKKLIMTLHKKGLNVIMDVVYNHTYRSQDSNFNIIMPNYYYRTLDDGTFSNGSGCGNEFATERPMVRKFIIDSLLYWLTEYKVDGFRFDLMGLIDIDTIKEAISILRKKRPDLIIYGEPWGYGISTLPNNLATKKGTQGNNNFALFNDDFRNAIKGDSDGSEKGFIHGDLDDKIATETGIAGSIYYDDDHIGFAMNPSETINYVNSHDNLIMADKMQMIYPNMDNDGMKRLNKIAFSILFTSQGIPFIHAGNEFLRTKNMNKNTYNAPLSINAIDWSLKEKNLDFYNYFKDLISLRKRYKSLRMISAEEIKQKLRFIDNPSGCGIIAYTIMEDKDKYLLILHNPHPHNCFISKLSIKEHLNKSYKENIIETYFKLILDENGLVGDNGQLSSEYGIEVPYYATLVLELRPHS